MDYMKIWMKAKRKLMEVTNKEEPYEEGGYRVYRSDAEALLRLLTQIEMEEYFGEDAE